MEKFDLGEAACIHYNMSTSKLYEESIRREENTIITCHGALRALTGHHTGRSPLDKFIVRDDSTEKNVFWKNNGDISPSHNLIMSSIILLHIICN